MNTPRGEPRFSNCSFPHQMEVHTVPALFRQVTSHGAESSLEFHPHRKHQIACREAGIPDLPTLVRVLALTGLGADLLANYLAELGRAGEVLVAVGRLDWARDGNIRSVRCGGLASSACDLLPHDREYSLRAPAIRSTTPSSWERPFTAMLSPAMTTSLIL